MSNDPMARDVVLVVQPDPKGDLDRFTPWLDEDGLDVRVVRPYAGDPVPDTVAEAGLIVLGGSMGALDEGDHPWLSDVKSLLRDAVSSNVPTLGICLGAQLLADALGGKVERGAAGFEGGVVLVRWEDAAAADPVVPFDAGPFLAGAMHFDAITRLPPGSVLLGTGDVYPHQAFRIGSAWGVQFHPEISPERFRSWRSEIPAEWQPAYDNQARVFDEVDGQVSTGARQLARRFARAVRG